MRPSEIEKTLQAAKFLRSKSHYGTPESLILAYVVWEGLKVRILIAGLAKQGWQQNTFKTSVMGEDFWRSKNYNRAFKSVFGAFPEQLSATARVWEEIKIAEEIRGKFVHGMGQKNPAKIDHAYNFLVKTIEDREWISKLSVILPNQEVCNIGEVFKIIRTSRGVQRDQSVERLKVQLGFKNRGN
jgi:hypothetical protein